MLGDVEDVVVGDVLRRLDWGCGGPWRCLFGCRLCVLRGRFRRGLGCGGGARMRGLGCCERAGDVPWGAGCRGCRGAVAELLGVPLGEHGVDAPDAPSDRGDVLPRSLGSALGLGHGRDGGGGRGPGAGAADLRLFTMPVRAPRLAIDHLIGVDRDSVRTRFGAARVERVDVSFPSIAGDHRRGRSALQSAQREIPKTLSLVPRIFSIWSKRPQRPFFMVMNGINRE